MLEGLEILIKRMDTNPEEFIDGRWDYFIEDNPLSQEIFTEEELQAFADARVRLTEFKRERHRQRFTEQVITHIFESDNRATGSHPLQSRKVTDIIRHGVEKMQMEYDWGRK